MPDRLRTSASDFRGSILSSSTLALALTHQHAYVWDYTSPVPVAHPRVFDIPQASSFDDPLPFGALVTNGASPSTGLLVVSATGRMVFWESIDSAESLGLFKQKNTGVEGSLAGLFSGETAVGITNADHAGFIITLSSGRVAHVNLRDAQGKPKISSQFLRSNDAAQSGGLLGGLKSVLGVGAWKRDIAAVRTRPLGSRGQMQVIAATENAQVQVWDLAWSGQSSFNCSIDFRPLLQKELVDVDREGHATEVKVLDMAVLPSRARGDEVGILGDTPPLSMLLLTQVGGHPDPDYALVEATLAGKSARSDRVVPIKRNASNQDSGDHEPRLMVPNPGHAAFIVFEDKIVVISVTGEEEDSPEAQLLLESNRTPEVFQDTIFLREDKNLKILGLGEEEGVEKSGTSSGAIFVKGLGLVRLTAYEPTVSMRPRISAKSRIEQAIFYGTMPDNVLDFSHRQGPDEYDEADIAEAAKAVSDEILRSESRFIPALTSTLDDQLSIRQKALRALITHLRKNYPSLSRQTAWSLMQDAEKMAAVQALWTRYDYDVQRVSKRSPRPTWLPHVISAIHLIKKRLAEHDYKEGDMVRNWFVHHADEIDDLRYQSMLMIMKLHDLGRYKDYLNQCSEADELLFACYETAFKFRSDNCELYGFDPTLFVDGVLEDGQYEGFVESWLSFASVFNTFNTYLDKVRDFTINFYERVKDIERPAAIEELDNYYIDKLAADNPRLVDILCCCYRERIGWLSNQPTEAQRRTAEQIREQFAKARHHHFRELARLGQSGAGISIAEKFRDFSDLAVLVMEEYNYLTEMIEGGFTDVTGVKLLQSEFDAAKEKLENLNKKTIKYFKVFGKEWSTAFFDYHVGKGNSYMLLKDAELYQEPLTQYLRASRRRAKLGWINEVLQEKSFPEAQKALTHLAKERETNLWNKKVELSIGKLAALAMEEEGGSKTSTDTLKQTLCDTEDELTITRIQDALYGHIRPLLWQAVDREAEVQFVSDIHAQTVKRLPALHQVVYLAIENLVNHRVLSTEQLLDLLTLMDSVSHDESDTDIEGTEFHLALQVLKAAKQIMDEHRWETAFKVVWQRLLTQDDWAAINSTSRKSDALIKEQVRSSKLCQTMAMALKDGEFDRHHFALSHSKDETANTASHSLYSPYPRTSLPRTHRRPRRRYRS